MKKLVFLFVAFAAISLASCGNGKNDEAANAADSDSVATVDTTAADTVAADSVAADSVK